MPSAPGRAGKPDLVLAMQDSTQPPAVCLEPPYCWHQHPGCLDALGLLVVSSFLSFFVSFFCLFFFKVFLVGEAAAGRALVGSPDGGRRVR